MRPIADRVVQERRFRWRVEVMEPGGVWFVLGRTWTRTGARAMLRLFLRMIP